MIFKPADPAAKLWDTFIYPWDGKFYMYYLEFREAYWDGYALAVSDDLIHWTDHGNIMHLGAGSGSGVVYRTGDHWMMSICKITPDGPCIRFAKSYDLYKWDLMPDEYNMYPDARWYHADFKSPNSCRYDSMMWIEKQPDGSFLGLFTASSADGPVGGNGVIGSARSTDGLHWEAGPPASAPCGMGWAELVDHTEINGRHYCLVGNTGGMGRRFDPVYNTTGKCGGMYVMASDKPEGPYEIVEGDALLLGCRNAPANWAYLPAYSTSTFKWQGKTLLNHHWMPRKDFTDSWLGTIKELVEEMPRKLGLYYWDGNEKLKGRLILDLEAKPQFVTPQTYFAPFGTLTAAEDGGVALSTAGTAVSYVKTENLDKGIFIEAVIRLHGEGAGGLFFGNARLSGDKPYEGSALLFNTRGLVEFGTVTMMVCGPSFMPENQIEWQIKQDEDIHLRVLVRGEFIEAYIQDKLVQCYGFTRTVTANIGLFAECDGVDLKSLRAYEFDL